MKQQKMDIKQTYNQANRWAHDKAAQMGAGGALTTGVVIIALLIVGFVGIMILNSTQEATNLVENDTLYNASTQLTSVTETVFSMYGVLIIVLIAAVIIGLLLSSFLGGGGMQE
jgi:cytochrome b